MRMHDLDTLGGDETFNEAGIAADAQRVHGLIDQKHRFTARGLELGRQRSLACRDYLASARAQKRMRNIDGSAGDRILAQSRHHLQDCGAGQAARGCMLLWIICAQAPNPGVAPRWGASRACMSWK